MGAMLFNGQHGRMMRAIPLSRLSRFPGVPFSEAALADAVRRFSRLSRGPAGDLAVERRAIWVSEAIRARDRANERVITSGVQPARRLL